MKTITINTAGKRATAYISERNNLVRGGFKNTKISVKESKKLVKDKDTYYEGVNYKTYIL